MIIQSVLVQGIHVQFQGRLAAVLLSRSVRRFIAVRDTRTISLPAKSE